VALLAFLVQKAMRGTYSVVEQPLGHCEIKHRLAPAQNSLARQRECVLLQHVQKRCLARIVQTKELRSVSIWPLSSRQPAYQEFGVLVGKAQ
jgi:hypothetical protein